MLLLLPCLASDSNWSDIYVFRGMLIWYRHGENDWIVVSR